MPRYAFAGALTALFLVFIALRVVHLDADPPADLDWSAGLFFDEGMLVHGARSKLLFGSWALDEWSDFYISPILFYIKWLVFSLVGIGIVQQRVIPVFFSGLTLVLFYLTLRDGADRRTGLLAVLLLGFNYVFIMFNRVGLTETALVFFMVLTAFLWQKAMASPRDTWPPGAGRWRRNGLFLAVGVVAFVVYVIKTAPYFLPVPVLALLLWHLVAADADRGPTGAHRRGGIPGWAYPLSWCLPGMLATFLVWYFAFYSRHSDSINQALSYYRRLAVPRSLDELLYNVSHLPFFDYFLQTPVTLFLSAFAIGYVMHLAFNDRGRLRPLDLFMLTWYLLHFAQYAAVTYRPVRHYVPIIPPMCALAARLMLSLADRRSLSFPRLSLACLPILTVWLTVLLAYGIFPLASRFPPSLQLPLPASTWAQRTWAAVAVAVVILALVAALPARWRGRGPRLSRRAGMVAFVALPLLAFLVVQGQQYYEWAARPRYVIRDISRELGQTLQDAFIAGLGAPMITLENQHRALHVYEGFFNYRQTLDRYPVTHLFMGAFNQEVEFYYRRFPERMHRATLLRVYPIQASHFYLYSLVEPTVEELEVAAPSAGADGALEVVLAVKNNEGTRGRHVQPGWTLLRLGGGQAPITVTASPRALAAGQTATLRVTGEVLPGTYRLMGFVLPGYESVFEAELLGHRIGDWVGDDEASNGQAWKVTRGDRNRGFAVFGPYVKYPAGHLRASFRLKTSDNSHSGPIAQLDISTEHRQFLALRELRRSDFQAPGVYQDFELSAILDATLQRVEFRVVAHPPTDVWVDRIRVEFVRGVWHEEPVTIRPTQAGLARSPGRRPGHRLHPGSVPPASRGRVATPPPRKLA